MKRRGYAHLDLPRLVKKMKHPFNTILLTATLAAVLLLSGCSQTNPAPAPNPSGQPPAPTAPVSVKTAAVQRGRLSFTLTYSGNVQARRQVSLLPKVAGRVVKLTVDVGSTVEEGDVLLELDKDTATAQVAQAEAGLAAAQAKLDGMLAGPRAEQVAQLQAGVDIATQKLTTLQNGPRPETVAQAEANLRAAQARLAALEAGPTQPQIDAAEAAARAAKNSLYAVEANADSLLSRIGSGYTPDMKEAQAGAAYEQVQVAEAQLAALKAPPSREALTQAQAAVDAAAQQLALAQSPFTEQDIRQAELGVRAAEQQLKLAQSPFTRQDLDAMRAQVGQAKAAVDLAKVQLAETTVRAPFAGLISQRLVSEGAMVGPSTPLLTLISGDTEVVVNVDERSLENVRLGLPATVTVGAYAGAEFKATVSVVSPSVDTRSRTVQVRLSPEDTGGKLRDGMFAQVRLSADSPQGETLLVPKDAVVQEERETVVYVVSGGRARRQVVKTGASDGDRIEIVEGLADRQFVAVSGLSGLRDGTEVAAP